MAAYRALMGLTTSPEGRDGLLRGLEQALRASGALRAQFASLLAKQLHPQPGGCVTPRRSSPDQEALCLQTCIRIKNYIFDHCRYCCPDISLTSVPELCREHLVTLVARGGKDWVKH